MGGSYIPTIAGRLELAFVCKIRQIYNEFTGEVQGNFWLISFNKTGFVPSLGYGFVLIGKNGGAVRLWVWMNDFSSIAPHKKKYAQLSGFFLIPL